MSDKTLFHEIVLEYGDETQKFCELIFDTHGLSTGELQIKKGKDEILDFKDNMYEWFEIYSIQNKVCFGWWDEKNCEIKWFVEKEKANEIKDSIIKIN